MSIYKEQILPAINNRRASPSFVERIEGNNFNYTQNSNKMQTQIVSAIFSSIHKSIVIYLLDNQDKRVVFFG